MLQKTLTMDPPASGAVAGASVGQDAASAPPQQSERDQLQVLRCWCTCCVEQHPKKLIAAARLKVASCIKALLIRLPDDYAGCIYCSCQPCFHSDLRTLCTVICTQPVLLSAMLCCAVLSRAVLSCAVLCCAVLCCAVLCCAVLCCAVLCRAVLHHPVLCRAVPCCAMPCCAMLCWLCCTALCCTMLCASLDGLG